MTPKTAGYLKHLLLNLGVAKRVASERVPHDPRPSHRLRDIIGHTVHGALPFVPFEHMSKKAFFSGFMDELSK